MNNVLTVKNYQDEEILVFHKPLREFDAIEEKCYMWLEFYTNGEPYIYIRAKRSDVILTMNDNVIKLGLLKASPLTEYQGGVITKVEEVSAVGPLRPIFITAVRLFSDHYVAKYVLSDLESSVP